MNLEGALKEITETLKSCNEWLLIGAAGKTFAFRKDEIEIAKTGEKILFSFLDDKGFQTWRVAQFEKTKNEIVFKLTRNFGRERETIRLVPRAAANELSASVEAARLEQANRIASLIVSETEGARLVRVALNEDGGRFAQIVFENARGKQTAALADVTGALTPENLLTAAILWLSKLENRKTNPIENVWILADKRRAKNLQKLHTLLRENWKAKIKIFEISGARLNAKSEMRIADLWREKAKKIQAAENREASRAAREIVKLAPDKIDSLFTNRGETLRFLGLPFARVRKVFDREKVWFGVERTRQVLNDSNLEEFRELIENLQTYRRFDSPNKHHKFYTGAAEAWLESVLRRNIKQLDANLILSPLYNQFRAERDKIDLLALRRDGRLVVVEIKVAPDREMIFQAADYWRKIERQRRAGNLQAAKIFGDWTIADKPAIVYLVAPVLSYHRDFEFLAKTVSPEIEIYQFGLNENWRESLRVMKRNFLTGRNN